MKLVPLPGFPSEKIRPSVLKRIKAWKVIRDKSQNELNDLFLQKALNGIVKAVYRGQGSTEIWVFEDCFSKPGVNSTDYIRAEEACTFAELEIGEYGYRACTIFDLEKDQNGRTITSVDNRVIKSLRIEVSDLQEMSMETVATVRARWRSLNDSLPKEKKRKAWKKKNKK